MGRKATLILSNTACCIRKDAKLKTSKSLAVKAKDAAEFSHKSLFFCVWCAVQMHSHRLNHFYITVLTISSFRLHVTSLAENVVDAAVGFYWIEILSKPLTVFSSVIL